MRRHCNDLPFCIVFLRVLQEELGLDPACVRVVGCLPPFLSKHLLSVTPVIAVIPAHQQFHPNAAEVSGWGQWQQHVHMPRRRGSKARARA